VTPAVIPEVDSLICSQHTGAFASVKMPEKYSAFLESVAAPLPGRPQVRRADIELERVSRDRSIKRF
jgi:hypothetical protein